MVAHHPDDLGTHARRGGLDDALEAVVGIGLGEVGEVAGEHDRLGLRTRSFELVERAHERAIGVDLAVEGRACRPENVCR